MFTKTRTCLPLLVFAGAILAFISPAYASQTLGSTCTSVAGVPNGFGLSPAYTIPSDGVITSWGYHFATAPGGGGPFPIYPTTFSGSGSNWTITALGTSIPTITGGAQSTATRMPVKAGDLFGMTGTVLYCADPGGALLYGSMPTGPTVGQSLSTTSAADYVPGVWATLEPDADHDGYGDETQDKCPQSAKYQTACPVASAAGKAAAGKNAAVFTPTAPGDSTVTASAKVKLPKSGKHKARTLMFSSTPLVTANGVGAKLTLKYPSALKSALKKLSKHKKLKLTVNVTSTGLANTATKTYTLKLKGLKK